MCIYIYIYMSIYISIYIYIYIYYLPNLQMTFDGSLSNRLRKKKNTPNTLATAQQWFFAWTNSINQVFPHCSGLCSWLESRWSESGKWWKRQVFKNVSDPTSCSDYFHTRTMRCATPPGMNTWHVLSSAPLLDGGSNPEKPAAPGSTCNTQSCISKHGPTAWWTAVSEH